MINQNTFKNLLQPVFDSQANWYKKQTNVFARLAKVGERVATITADGLETENMAEQGDYLVKNQTKAKEQYLMSATKFNTRYEWVRKSNHGFDLYRAKGKVRAIELTSEVLKALRLDTEFYFEAPWGEKMIAKQGDFIAQPIYADEVYRIARKEFFETYALMA
ncbi:MAG: hypothetical protein HC892_06420 [Saprospiraceae bacterium]|nr:hypothetical protein [Saprospiraceae bacterium]